MEERILEFQDCKDKWKRAADQTAKYDGLVKAADDWLKQRLQEAKVMNNEGKLVDKNGVILDKDTLRILSGSTGTSEMLLWDPPKVSYPLCLIGGILSVLYSVV